MDINIILNLLKENIVVLLILAGAVVTWRSGLVKSIGEMSKSQSDLYKTQRDDALIEIASLKREVAQNKEEARFLSKDALTRAEIAVEDRQTIRDLQKRIRELE